MDASQRSGLWAEAFRVQRRGVDLRAGAVGAFSACAPLAIGIATGHDAIGSAACFGGLNACLAVPRGSLRTRVGWGVGAGLGCILAAASPPARSTSANGPSGSPSAPRLGRS